MGRFLAIFSAIVLALFTLELTPPAQEWVVNPWTTALAKVVATLLTTVDHDVLANGRMLMNMTTAQGVVIEPGCNGVEATILILAAILAFPAPWKKRLAGLAAGLVAVQGLNIVRLVSLYYLVQWNKPVFEWTHLYLWQPLIMVDVLIVWLVWLRWISRDRKAEPVQPPPPAEPPADPHAA
jgi:exosortase H (IPTLxxWG-CTERM-specific)